MTIERLISGLTWLLVGGFTAAWLVIMLTVAVSAELPIVGFAVTIGAGLVVYSVRSAVAPREAASREPLVLC